MLKYDSAVERDRGKVRSILYQYFLIFFIDMYQIKYLVSARLIHLFLLFWGHLYYTIIIYVHT